jgi:hypothetical protein
MKTLLIFIAFATSGSLGCLPSWDFSSRLIRFPNESRNRTVGGFVSATDGERPIYAR